jgi:transcriptional regulator with XRE-family HTH domain
LGDRLRKARELTGLNLSDFADEIGVDRKSARRYETDQTVPRPYILAAWAMRTGFSVDQLRGADQGGDLPPAASRCIGVLAAA